MNKDIKKYKRKKIINIALLGITTFTCMLVAAALLDVFIANGMIFASAITIASYGFLYCSAINNVIKKHYACNNTISQLNLKEELKNFNEEDKNLLKESIENKNSINYKSKSRINIDIKDNMEVLQEKFSLLKEINSNDKVMSLLSGFPKKYGSISNLSEALTTSDTIPADVIYQTEKIKTKRKIRKINKK